MYLVHASDRDVRVVLTFGRAIAKFTFAIVIVRLIRASVMAETFRRTWTRITSSPVTIETAYRSRMLPNSGWQNSVKRDVHESASLVKMSPLYLVHASDRDVHVVLL